jgi:hypothetical protein
VIHGTPSGYSYHGCRCAECTEAKRVALARAAVAKQMAVRQLIRCHQAEYDSLYRIGRMRLDDENWAPPRRSRA